MLNRTKLSARAIFLNAVIVAGISLSIWLSGCGSSKPAQQAPQRYSLNGRVVSIERAKQQVVVDHGEITGFMMAMTSGWKILWLSRRRVRRKPLLRQSRRNNKNK